MAQLWLVFVKKPSNWTVCDHMCTKNTSSVTVLFVLQVQWLKYTHVTSLVTTHAIYSSRTHSTQQHRARWHELGSRSHLVLPWTWNGAGERSPGFATMATTVAARSEKKRGSFCLAWFIAPGFADGSRKSNRLLSAVGENGGDRDWERASALWWTRQRPMRTADVLHENNRRHHQ
jgi:hypothetical protein